MLWSRFGGLLRRGGRLGGGDRSDGRRSEDGWVGTGGFRTTCRPFDIGMGGDFSQDVGQELCVVPLKLFGDEDTGLDDCMLV